MIRKVFVIGVDVYCGIFGFVEFDKWCEFLFDMCQFCLVVFVVVREFFEFFFVGVVVWVYVYFFDQLGCYFCSVWCEMDICYKWCVVIVF